MRMNGRSGRQGVRIGRARAEAWLVMTESSLTLPSPLAGRGF
jgi:hypothetical protein